MNGKSHNPNLAKDFKSETKKSSINVHQWRDLNQKLSVLKLFVNFSRFFIFLTTPNLQAFHRNNCWKLTGGKKQVIEVFSNFVLKMFDQSGSVVACYTRLWLPLGSTKCVVEQLCSCGVQVWLPPWSPVDMQLLLPPWSPADMQVCHR